MAKITAHLPSGQQLTVEFAVLNPDKVPVHWTVTAAGKKILIPGESVIVIEPDSFPSVPDTPDTQDTPDDLLPAPIKAKMKRSPENNLRPKKLEPGEVV